MFAQGLFCLQAVRKVHGHLKAVQEAAVDRTLPQAKPITLTPQEQTLDEDLDDAAQVSNVLVHATPSHTCHAPHFRHDDDEYEEYA